MEPSEPIPPPVQETSTRTRTCKNEGLEVGRKVDQVNHRSLYGNFSTLPQGALFANWQNYLPSPRYRPWSRPFLLVIFFCCGLVAKVLYFWFLS
uniref:Uncharacterized protein n=1 Tax=Rhizophora mucronata TaxID=61149 RepID=A0A2P2PC56_RHIMU